MTTDSANDANDRSVNGTSQVRGGVRRLLALCQNPMSLIGLLLTTLALILVLTFVLFSIVTGVHNPYLDVIGYLILPTLFGLGLATVPIGALWKHVWLRRHAGVDAPRRVHVDFGDPATRSAIAVFAAVTCFVVLPVIGLTSYQGYAYTESTEFCAQVCHTVMEPQGTAHANSPHARVECAECHIGEGAGWFVKSKLSGTRQVLAVWRDTFSRPIPSAITELRPARDTCEQCHWPAKFYGSQLKEVIHYAPDEQNTRRVVRMLLKTGGADESIGRLEGIHMHMLVDGRIEYVATDDKLQHIPWVRYVKGNGDTVVYRSDGEPNDGPPPAGIRRIIDCMDCHNRGAHHFYSPQSAVNLQIEAGRIDRGLPFIQREVVSALVQAYDDPPAAEAGIRQRIHSFYAEDYPGVWEARRATIDAAVATAQDIYRRNIFPGMKVNWRSYPENIGHLYSPGCFRCHDGRHVDARGVAIASDCRACHTFLNPVDGQSNQFTEGEFQHSMSLRFHENLRCEQCHNGGKLPLCYDCHTDLRGLEEWKETGTLRRQPADMP